MNTTVEKNNPKVFPNNEGRVNSKGTAVPPVPLKSHQTKFAGMKAIFERNASHFQVNDSSTVSSNLGKTFGPKMRKLMEDGDINIHVSASTPSKQRRNSGDSGVSSCSDVSGRTSDDEDRVIVNAFDQDNHQKSPDLHRVQAADELETIKFLKMLSKKEREDFGFSPKQQNNQKVETSRKTCNPLDWNPIYQGKKHFSLDNMSSSSSSCSEKSNISDISDKSNNSNIVRCNITRSNSKQDLRKPDVIHNDKPTDKKLSNVKVSELIRKFEQGSDVIKGR